MRSTLIHYRVSEIELDATLVTGATKWFNLDQLENHNFPLERLACPIGSRVVRRINWERTFARRGFDMDDYRPSYGSRRPDDHHFYLRKDRPGSLPQMLSFYRKGSESDTVQGDLITYAETETGLHMQPCLVVKNCVKEVFARALAKKKKSVPRAWLASRDEVDALSLNVTASRALEWSRQMVRDWDPKRSWAYLSYTF